MGSASLAPATGLVGSNVVAEDLELRPRSCRRFVEALGVEVLTLDRGWCIRERDLRRLVSHAPRTKRTARAGMVHS